MELYENKRPPDVQIKLVEAIGIIMRIPFSSSPSRYKAPLPTNYDGTVNLLMNDLSGVISELAGYSSSSIPNDIARDLYAKTLDRMQMNDFISFKFHPIYYIYFQHSINHL